jgi:polyisoprenoid-binding protein YceI
LTKSSVQVTIKTASINTENEFRDKHLRSADFFDADNHPEITFVSKKITRNGKGYIATGPLNIRGISKDVTIPFSILGVTKGNKGETRMGAEGSTQINRQDYKVSWSKFTDNGGLVVSNEVRIELNVEAVKEESSAQKPS